MSEPYEGQSGRDNYDDSRKRSRESRDRDRGRERDRSRERDRRYDDRSHRDDKSRDYDRRLSRERSRERDDGERRREGRRERKRKSNWDVQPPEGIVLPAIGMSSQPGGDGMQNLSVSRQSRRLYVGNIPPSVSEDDVAQFFNENMKQATPGRRDDPVLQVNINLQKMFAFVEFRHTDDATAALLFDGLLLHGATIRVKRPKDYQVPSASDMFLGSHVADGPDKVFVGGLPSYLDADQIKELLTTFGELKAFHLVMDANTGSSKGFAFCEFSDPEVTDLACQGLNNMDLGGRTITVQRASSAQIPGVGTSSNSIPLGVGDTNYVAQATAAAVAATLGIGGGLSTALASTELTEQTATRILVLVNMFTREEIIQDDIYEEIEDDIHDEAVKYGTVRSIMIPRPSLNPEENMPGVGKVFVEFDTVDQSKAARSAFAGRLFNKRMVITSFQSEDSYVARKYD